MKKGTKKNQKTTSEIKTSEETILKIEKVFLTPGELLSLANTHSELTQINSEISILNRDIKIEELEMQLKSNAIKELRLAKEEKEKRIKPHILFKAKNITDELKSKYSLGEQWGYDPQTGEIRNV